MSFANFQSSGKAVVKSIWTSSRNSVSVYASIPRNSAYSLISNQIKNDFVNVITFS